MMHIGIAGAGLAGRLLAFTLARRGFQVSVYDPAGHAADRAAAGWTAAGMLSPLAELETGNDYVYQLGKRSLTLWQDIQQQTQSPLELAVEGSLMLAHRGDEGSARRLISLLERKAPPDDRPERLSTEQLLELEPALQPTPNSWLLRREGRIHTQQAMRALLAAAPGVHWHWRQPVKQLKPGCLQFEQGEDRFFDWVFDCRGVGARTLKYPNRHQLSCCNVRGVRGETIWLESREVRLSRPVRLLHPRYRVYIVPRQGSQFVVGASEIESEDRSPISVRTTVELLTAAHSVLPALAEARIIHTESNLRPALIDNYPRIENEPGLTRINGLFRHGWLIAPALTEEALQQSVLSAASGALMAAH